MQNVFLLLSVPDTKGRSCAQKTPPFFRVILQLTESGLCELLLSAPTQANGAFVWIWVNQEALQFHRLVRETQLHHPEL